MRAIPNDDKPGFVAEKPEHCFACYRLIRPGQTYYLTIKGIVHCEDCALSEGVIRLRDDLAVEVRGGRFLFLKCMLRVKETNCLKLLAGMIALASILFLTQCGAPAAELSDAAQLPHGCPPSCSGADLSYLDLHQVDLREADLGDANLGRANLEGADLSEADLHGADLEGASLREADLSGCNLQRASLYKADLYRANLEGADLTGASLTQANLFRADLLGAMVTQEQLARADLLGGATMPDGTVHE